MRDLKLRKNVVSGWVLMRAAIYRREHKASLMTIVNSSWKWKIGSGKKAHCLGEVMLKKHGRQERHEVSFQRFLGRITFLSLFVTKQGGMRLKLFKVSSNAEKGNQLTFSDWVWITSLCTVFILVRGRRSHENPHKTILEYFPLTD